MSCKHFIVILVLTLSLSLLTGCAEKSAEAAPETTAATAAPAVTEAVETAEDFVREFARAYFAGEALEPYLVSGYSGSWDSYQEGDGSKAVIHAVKGLENAEEAGKCTASVEFKTSEDSDYYLYLTVELVKEADAWKVAAYYLEM